MLSLSTLLLGISLSTIVTGAPLVPCSSIQIISARGSTEAAGEGRLAPIAQAIARSFSAPVTVSRSSVDYPASLYDYGSSCVAGKTDLTAQLTALARNCPNTKIVLLGYSAGAHVIGDTLAGGGDGDSDLGGDLGPKTAPISPAIARLVTAALFFGDPRHVNNEPFQKGTNVNSGAGIYARPADQETILRTYSNILGSWCDKNDFFCASGSSIGAHTGYFSKYNTAATQFAVGKLRAALG